MQEQLLQEMGPQLPFPHSSGVGISRHSHMRELRIQSHGDPLRVFYAFDPSLSFILEKGSTLEATVTWGDYVVALSPDALDLPQVVGSRLKWCAKRVQGQPGLPRQKPRSLATTGFLQRPLCDSNTRPAA